MYGHALPQVEGAVSGVHLMWLGPHEWPFSADGFDVQRRDAAARPTWDCVSIDSAVIRSLQTEHECASDLGVLTFRRGSWPVPLARVSAAAVCDVVRLELGAPTSRIRVTIQPPVAFVIAWRDGQAVAAGSPGARGASPLLLEAPGIDSVDVYLPKLTPFTLCADKPRPQRELDREWSSVPYRIRGLQLPLSTLTPGQNELATAMSRLLAGESIDSQRFAHVASLLRPCVKPPAFIRPIDQVLLSRLTADQPFQESGAMDALRTLLVHPTWRRVLGFAWLDADRALRPGSAYDYRITGRFPTCDLPGKVHGFADLPSQTTLPSEFYLQTVRFRLAQPARVELARATASSPLVHVARRGVALAPRHQHHWIHPDIQGASMVIDFPEPVQAVLLDLHGPHQLRFQAGGAAGLAPGLTEVPAGPMAQLTFPAPIEHLRLHGKGFLLGIRIVTGPNTLAPRSVVLEGVRLLDTPRPLPPVRVDVSSLQERAPLAETSAPSRHPLGFRVGWVPAPPAPLAEWPPDAAAGPPLDSCIFLIEQRGVKLIAGFPYDDVLEAARAAATGTPPPLKLIERLKRLDLPPDRRAALVQAVTGGHLDVALNLAILSAAPWHPLVGQDNWTLGSRPDTQRDRTPRLGADLTQLYPAQRVAPLPDPTTLSCRDVFSPSAKEPGDLVRPVPLPGTFHQYRIRTVDSIGRASTDASESLVLRLEKRVPPPLPAGPDEAPAGDPARPLGVHARLLVRGAADLTPQESALLGASQNAIVLRWGWHARHRELDPHAREFRVYFSRERLAEARAVLSNPVPLGEGRWRVSLALSRAVPENAAQGAVLHAGHPFHVLSHTAGSTVLLDLETRVPPLPGQPLAQPIPGAVSLPLRLSPDRTRPPAWAERVVVLPIVAASAYETILRDRLDLTAAHPEDSVLVGVSVADAEAYVADTFPGQHRPGNESPIVPVACSGRFVERPSFQPPAELAEVASLITDEPRVEGVRLRLDLAAHLAWSGLAPGVAVRVERAAEADILAACSVTASGVILGEPADPRKPTDSAIALVIPAPAEAAAMAAALSSPGGRSLSDRQLAYLAAIHPYRDRLFAPLSRDATPLGLLEHTLPPSPGRHVLRARLADAASNLSSAAAVARVVVRVPSAGAGVKPEKLPAAASDAPGTLRVRVPRGDAEAWLLTFRHTSVPPGEAVLLRVPNRRDLIPGGVVSLRLGDGTVLRPAAVPLSSVTAESDGSRQLLPEIEGVAGQRQFVWACTLTVDGVPSALAGPWGIAQPLPPLPVPALEASIQGQQVTLSWTWPAGTAAPPRVAIERSVSDSNWQRISASLPAQQGSFQFALSPGTVRCRVRVLGSDGRTALGEPVEIGQG